VAQKVTHLEGQLAVARQTQDTTKEKLPGLADKAVDTDR
jgi:hypothetical protein